MKQKREAIISINHAGKLETFKGIIKVETTKGFVVTHQMNPEIGEWFPFLSANVSCTEISPKS